MRLFKPVLVSCILLISSFLYGQDIHFTQFNMSPLTLNPALTGNYLGSYRIGGIYRNQWSSVIRAYSTPSFFVDVPVITGFRPQDWLAVGLVFYSDRAGTARMGRTAFLGSAAYHLGLNKKGTSVLSIGIQGGSQGRSLNLQGDQILLYEELASVNPIQSSDRNIGQNGTNYFDINGGVTLRSQLNKQMRVTVGFAMHHINRPEYGFENSGVADARQFGPRYVGHGEFNVDLNPKWSVTPSFIYQTIAAQDEIGIQMLGGYMLKPAKNIKLNAGLGYRLRDALQILVGMDWNDLRVGMSWDANTSGVTGSFNGGYEIAATYIGKIYKKPKVNPVIFCPRF